MGYLLIFISNLHKKSKNANNISIRCDYVLWYCFASNKNIQPPDSAKAEYRIRFFTPAAPPNMAH